MKTTIESMLANHYTLVAIEPRYNPAKVCVVLGPQQQHFFDFVDTLTDGGDEPQHVESILYNAPFMPYGYGNTIEEAINEALVRINKISELPEEQQEYAWLYVHNISYLPKGVTTYANVETFEAFYAREKAEEAAQ